MLFTRKPFNCANITRSCSIDRIKYSVFLLTVLELCPPEFLRRYIVNIEYGTRLKQKVGRPQVFKTKLE